jgi:hypothetical protein
LILHLVEFASSAERLSGAEVTKTAAVRAAAWCEYLESHARRCYGLLLDDGLRNAQALARKLQQGKISDGFTARDVRRQRWLYLSTEEAVEAAIDWLKGTGWLRDWEVGGTGPGSGHPTIRYAINPKVRREGKVEGGQDAELA